MKSVTLPDGKKYVQADTPVKTEMQIALEKAGITPNIFKNGENDTQNSIEPNENTGSVEITQQDIEVLRSISRKSINDFTPEEVQKTEKWAKKYWGELKEKSPFFRAWFGDWRSGDKTAVEVVTLTGEGGRMPTGKYKNADTGREISVARHIIKEMDTHTYKKQLKKCDTFC